MVIAEIICKTVFGIVAMLCVTVVLLYLIEKGRDDDQ